MFNWFKKEVVEQVVEIQLPQDLTGFTIQSETDSTKVELVLCDIKQHELLLVAALYYNAKGRVFYKERSSVEVWDSNPQKFLVEAAVLSAYDEEGIFVATIIKDFAKKFNINLPKEVEPVDNPETASQNI